MKTKLFSTLLIITAAGFMISCNKNGSYGNNTTGINAQIKSAAGDSVTVLSALNEFRTVEGNPLNTSPGATSGRREVNWDAVPAALTNIKNFPFDFFGASDASLPDGRKRGLLLNNTATSFRVDSTSFSEIESSYADQFKVFSKKRLFAYLTNNVTTVSFNVPGTTTAAFVKGFGVIFCDVDDAASTSVEYFNGAKSLGIYKAKPAPQGFSFVGVNFPDEKVTMVKITAGNGLLAAGVKDVSSGGTLDLVVMDDFIYDEPKPLN